MFLCVEDAVAVMKEGIREETRVVMYVVRESENKQEEALLYLSI